MHTWHLKKDKGFCTYARACMHSTLACYACGTCYSLPRCTEGQGPSYVAWSHSFYTVCAFGFDNVSNAKSSHTLGGFLALPAFLDYCVY